MDKLEIGELKEEIGGFAWFYNYLAFELAMWSVDEYENGNKDKAIRIKQVADRLEGRFRDNNKYEHILANGIAELMGLNDFIVQYKNVR